MGVDVVVRNTGARHGREVVQAYLARPDSAVERPALWLAGFAVAEADPGEAVRVTVKLEPRALEHWTGAGGWAVEPGAYELRVGPSAAEQPLRATIEVADAP